VALDVPRREQRRRRRIARIAVVALVGLGVAGWLVVVRPQSKPAAVERGADRAVVRAGRRRPRPARRHEARLVLPQVLPRRIVDVPILMYHRIDRITASLPAMTRALTVAPADFAQQMRWLSSHGYHAVSMRQLFAALEYGAPLPSRPVMITFDDGYRDVLTHAAPALDHLHMPATAYVITGRISGKDSSFLSWSNLRQLERDGIAVGSHTVHHLELPDLTDAQARRELLTSRLALERHLHHPVQWFAYPAGAETAHAARLVRAAGYVLAVTTSPGPFQDAGSPMDLKRYEILDSTGVAGIGALVRSG
jgi:peptidoglycan/xylan/chitin deacetylase (PgdA/CDA1 family)